MSLLEHFSLIDQAAIITGAGRGIGRQTALTLAEAGAAVVVSSRTTNEIDAVVAEIVAAGGRAIAVVADANDVTTLPNLVDRAVAEFGRLDVVVNNVGGSFPRPLLETSTAMFERAFHFNVTTALELSKAAIPAMLAGDAHGDHQGGAIVNISSLAGRLADRGFAAYGTAKAALTHLTRIMAADCAPRIRVNAIAVGSVETSALETVMTDEFRAQMESSTPLRRLGQPLDIALAALYLASPAGSFITGKILEVDGGLEAPNLPLGLADL